MSNNIKLFLDGDIEFDAFGVGEEWNGWVTPLFTFEQVNKVKEWFENSGQGTMTYDPKTDSFLVAYSWDDTNGFPDTVQGTDAFDGTRIYEFISFGWTWDVADDFEKSN